MENTFGKYRIAAPLTAKVSNPAYRARLSTAPEWNYVVKVYNEHKLHSLEAQEEWLRKMDALIHLEHPHILPVTYGIEEETPYSVTEYIKGGSLHDRLDRALPTQEVKKIILQVGQALQYAHEHHVLHGNIKPENVLLNENGDAFLVDFCVPGDPDETEHRLPTVGRFLETSNVDDDGDETQLTYYLPEEILSAKSDQRALGFLAYEMLSNQPGIVMSSSQLPAVQSLSKETPLVASPPAQEEWVAQINAILLKALAKEPGERYENIAALLEAINEVFISQLITTMVTKLLPAIRPVQVKNVTQLHPALPHIETHQLMSLMLRSTKTLHLYQKRLGWRGGVVIAALSMLGIFCTLLIWQSSFSLHSGRATASSTSPIVTPQGSNSGSLRRISTSTSLGYINTTVFTSSSGSATSTSSQADNPSPPDGSSSSHRSYGSSSDNSSSLDDASDNSSSLGDSSGNSSSLSGSYGSYNDGSSGSSPSSDPTPTPTFTPTPTPTSTPTPRTSRYCFWGPNCNVGGFRGGGSHGGGSHGRNFR
jgi:serine/threonine protein kinase